MELDNENQPTGFQTRTQVKSLKFSSRLLPLARISSQVIGTTLTYHPLATRYVPPHLRIKDETKGSEEQIRLIRQIKGFLNRFVNQ